MKFYFYRNTLMIDADTFKILRHMKKHHPELMVDRMEYHSLSHDIVQTQTVNILSDWCKRPKNTGIGKGRLTLYDLYKGTPIWEEADEDSDHNDQIVNATKNGLVCINWKSLQGHPKVIARRKRNTERKAGGIREARAFKSAEEYQLVEKQKEDPRTSHWFDRTGTDG